MYCFATTKWSTLVRGFYVSNCCVFSCSQKNCVYVKSKYSKRQNAAIFTVPINIFDIKRLKKKKNAQLVLFYYLVKLSTVNLVYDFREFPLNLSTRHQIKTNNTRKFKMSMNASIIDRMFWKFVHALNGPKFSFKF